MPIKSESVTDYLLIDTAFTVDNKIYFCVRAVALPYDHSQFKNRFHTTYHVTNFFLLSILYSFDINFITFVK